MEQSKLSNNCQTSPVSAGGKDIAHAQRAELDGRWRYGDNGNNCNREKRQGEYDREEGQGNRCRDAERKEQDVGCNRVHEQLEGSCNRDCWEQEQNCTKRIDLWSESCESVITWRDAVAGKGGGNLQGVINFQPCSESFSRDWTPPSGSECKGDILPPADCKWDGTDAVPAVSGEDEWRKKKHRRRPSKKKRRWKPYFKLSWEEKRQLEERESQRAARLRAEMFAKGQPVAPYNTTQFLMEDHAQAEPDLRSGGGTDSSEDEPLDEESEGPGSDGTGGPGAGLRPGGFLLKDFSETYERYHTESLQNMSKQQLVREYLELEKCLSRMEDENNRLRKQGLSVPPAHVANERSDPPKDFNSYAGNYLQHLHNRGTARQQTLLPMDDADQGTDSISTEYSLHLQSGDFHGEAGPLPRGYPLQLFRSESQPEIGGVNQHPRIQELELELNMLRAQNTQLMQEKKNSTHENSCRD